MGQGTALIVNRECGYVRRPGDEGRFTYIESLGFDLRKRCERLRISVDGMTRRGSVPFVVRGHTQSRNALKKRGVANCKNHGRE